MLANTSMDKPGRWQRPPRSPTARWTRKVSSVTRNDKAARAFHKSSSVPMSVAEAESVAVSLVLYRAGMRQASLRRFTT